MSILQAIILAIVEGLTEFLPISSTGHMIIVSALMGLKIDTFAKVFMVSIQLGAILSVVVLYFKRFFQNWNFYFKLCFAFLPTGILGLLLKSHIDALLENVWVVATSLLVGGVGLLFVDKFFAKNEQQSPENQDVSYMQGFWIGVAQSVAMCPGVSRSAASIVGGLFQGLNRKTAAEFSFFLAVPTMFLVTLKSLYDEKDYLMAHTNQISLILLGNLVAFAVGMLAIKFFVGILTKYGFRVFGYYRILIGLVLLICLLSGVNLSIV